LGNVKLFILCFHRYSKVMQMIHVTPTTPGRKQLCIITMTTMAKSSNISC